MERKIDLSLSISDFNLILEALVSHAIKLSDLDCLIGAEKTKSLLRELRTVKKMFLKHNPLIYKSVNSSK